MQNISSLKHSQFLTAADDRTLAVTVHPKLAATVMRTSLIPDDYRLAYKMWPWIWISLVPVAVAVGHLYSWWVTPVVLIVLLSGFLRTVNSSAARYVFDYAKESELFYDIMVQLGIMTVQMEAGRAGARRN